MADFLLDIVGHLLAPVVAYFVLLPFWLALCTPFVLAIAAFQDGSYVVNVKYDYQCVCRWWGSIILAA